MRKQLLTTSLVFLSTYFGAIHPRSAHADDLSIFVTPNGLNFLSAQLGRFLPPTLTLGDVNKSVTCVNFNLSKIEAHPKEAAATLTADASKLTAELGFSATGSVRVKADPCVGPTVTCNVDFSLTDAQVRATGRPQVVDGKPKLTDSDVKITIDTNDVSLKFPDCGVANTVMNIDLIKEQVVKQLSGAIQKEAEKQLPVQLESAVGRIATLTGQFGEMSVQGDLAALRLEQSGLVVAESISMEALKPATCASDTAVARVRPQVTPQFKAQSDELVLALSVELVGHAVNTLWKNGALCYSPQQVAENPSFLEKAVMLGQLIGLTDPISMSLAAPNAPVVGLSADAAPKLLVNLTGLTMHLTGVNPGGKSTTATALFNVTLGLGLEVNAATSGVFLKILDTSVSGVTLTADNADGLALDTALFSKLLQSIVIPRLALRLSKTALIPQVLHQSGGIFDGYYLYVTGNEIVDPYIYLQGRFFAKPQHDDVAPDTTFVNTPDALTNAQPFVFEATGTDDQVPVALLRYSWRIDDQDWTPPQFARQLQVPLVAGTHVVSVRAVDLNDNIDATPATVAFEVDAQPPQLALVSGPGPAVKKISTVSIEVKPTDDKTESERIAVQASAEVALMGKGGSSEVIEEFDFDPAHRQINLSLVGDGTYRVKFIARDAAGNLSKPLVIEFSATETGTDNGIGSSTDGNGATTPGGCECAVTRNDHRGGRMLSISSAVWLMIGLGLIYRMLVRQRKLRNLCQK